MDVRQIVREAFETVAPLCEQASPGGNLIRPDVESHAAYIAARVDMDSQAAALEAENADLKNQVAALQSQVSALQASAKMTVISDVAPAPAPSVQTEPAPPAPQV